MPARLINSTWNLLCTLPGTLSSTVSASGTPVTVYLACCQANFFDS
ncbi:BgtTE-56079 [Blumeria graminis f. sp. tritici]|uniref:BgtTE-56079 n=1 Tax=Blumeria graminis f. sp. tritici TaxID=62690 RepID=A0A9X9MIV4_BLUGR|nr:BgtTE-56079 [Blumeria graminis f. sp. tritici]